MTPDTQTTAIVVVDLQGDFTQVREGSLAVDGTDQAWLEAVAAATEKLRRAGYRLYATRDYHPRDHVSFFSNHEGVTPLEIKEINGRPQVMWPPHCVMETPGSQLLIEPVLFDAVVKKGCDKQFDSYSGFFDDGGAATGLEKILKEDSIQTLIMYGLATDFCVKATAMDAVKTGFDVILVQDLCRGVAPDSTAAALEEMQKAGVRIIESKQILG